MIRTQAFGVVALVLVAGAVGVVACSSSSGDTTPIASNDAGPDLATNETPVADATDDALGDTTPVGDGGAPPVRPSCTATPKPGTIATLSTGPTPAKGDIWSLTNVVATSQKFRYEKSKKGVCLFGVFVADANATFQPNSGILLLSEGNHTTLNAAGRQECEFADKETASFIPPTVKPGDTLTLTGSYSLNLNSKCTSGTPTHGQPQLEVCAAATVGAPGTVPAPAVVDPASLLDGSPDVTKWAGGLVSLAGAKIRTGTNPTATPPQFGLTLDPSGLLVTTKIAYHGGNSGFDSTPAPGVVETSLVGLSYLDFGCTWAVSVRDVCTDMVPAGNAACAGGGDAGTETGTTETGTTETGTTETGTTDAAAGG